MILKNLENRIKALGGFCNAHAHLDRAYTYNLSDRSFSKKHLFEKWKYVEKLKLSSSEEDYYNRIMFALEEQKKFGVQSVLSFIDIDPIAEHRALDAALRAKKDIEGISLKIATQMVNGVVEQKRRKLVESRLEDIDVIGGLPKVESFSSHMDIICSWAKDTGKRLHVHVDQLNSSSERETEMLCNYAKEYNLENMITAVHSISLAAHPKEYRNRVYGMCKDVGLSFISCPSAWIDSPRKEEISVTHNSCTPVDELIENGIKVAIGSDNINDIYKPYSDGNMLVELRFLLEINKIYDEEQLINIAINNGIDILGGI